MNKQSLILYITLAILFLNTTLSFGQCVVCVDAPPLITCGETATLTGDGFLTTAGFSDDFNSGIGALWANISTGGGTNVSCTGSPTAFSNCAGGGVVPAGDHLWFPQGSAVPRQATTIGIPVPSGGDIIFEFKMEAQSAPGCDGPDLIGEGTMLQYLTAGAAVWQDVTTTMSPFDQNPMPYTNKAYFCPTNPLLQSFTSWNQYTIPIPAAAFSANTQFRWRQMSPTSQQWDFWGLENVNIVPSSPGGANYTWTPGGAGQSITVSPTSLTSYTFTYTNNGISCSTTVIVDVAPPIVYPVIIPNPLQPCPNLVDLSADASFNSCNYKIYLYDNGGDGWNTIPQTPTSIDTRLEVYVDGILSNTLTMNGGYGPVIYSIPVTAGGIFETKFLTGGPNPSECAYFIEDNQGQLIIDPTSLFVYPNNAISAMGLTTSPSSPFWPIPAGVPPSTGFSVIPADFGPVSTVCPTTNLYSYSWLSSPGGSTAGIGTPNSPTTTVTATAGPQDYEVCIQDQSNFGCIDCEVITVPGNPGIGSFDFVITSANPTCDDGTFPTITFELSSSSIPADDFSFDLQEVDALGTVLNTIPYVFPIWMGSGFPYSFNLPSPGSAGTYIYQIANLVDVNGCSIGVTNNPVTLTITQQGDPGTSPSSPINFCPNDPTIPVPGSVYDLSTYIAPADPGGDWTLLSISMASGLPFTFNPLTNVAGVYTYTVVNAPCPALSSDVTVGFFTLPPAPIVGNDVACEGAVVIPPLTAIEINNITWYDDALLTNVLGNGTSFATGQTTAGVYTYYVTETNVDGCEGPVNPVTLEIFPIPAAPIATNEEVCFQLPTPALTAIGINLTWYDDPALVPANQVGVGNSFPTGQTVVGTYIYYVTETTNGCESAASIVTLTIHPEPIILAFTSSAATIAQGNPINLTVDMAVGGTPPFTIDIIDDDIPANPYTITIPIPNMSGSVAATPNVTPVTTYTITSVTDGNGCTNPSGWTVPVTVDPYPIIDPFNTADNEICYGTIPSINMTLYQGQVPVTVNYTYNGVTTDEIIGTVGIPVNIPLDTAELNIGTNTIIINSVTDNSGNISPSNLIPNPVVITVHPTPIVTFGQDDVICFEEEDAILEFDFLVGTEPFDVGYTINTIAQPPLSFSANGTQTYTLTPNPAVGDNTYNMIQVTDDNGCLSALNATLPVTIRVNPTPELGITVKDPNPICVGDTSALFFPVTTLLGPAPSHPYTLDYLSGTTLSTLIVDDVGNIILTGTTHPIFPIVTTDYTLVSVVDNNGCSNTFIDSDQLVVNELPSVNISGDAEICRQDVTKLYFNTNAGDSPWQVYYNINGTPDSITLYNSADSITLSPTITTVYKIDSVSDILCSSPIIDAATITVNQLPEIEVSGGGSVCDDGSEINVIITTTSGTPTFNIEYTVGLNSRSASNIGYQYIINTNETGTYSVTKATDSKNCIAQSITGNATVNINPMPEANIIAYPQPADIDNPVIYFIDESMLHVNGVWDFGYFGSLTDTTLENGDKINHTFKDTGTYIVALEVMTDSGCVITAYQTIIIDQAFKIYIPTAFTPNNDLYNDYFLPIVDGVQEYNLEIYDRFGGTIFMTEETNEAWDGKQKNGTEYAIAGNYIYHIKIIDFGGKERTYQGALTLIR